MLRIGKPQITASTFALLLFLNILPSVSSSSTVSSAPSSLSQSSICPSRTINYITETLPQQCLRTDWTSNHGGEGKNGSAKNGGEQSLVTLERTENATPSEMPNTTAVSTDSSTTHSANSETNISTEDKSVQQASSSEPAASPSLEPSAEQESDPLSDNANFLSFEEWKAQMLKKAGQSAENIGGARKGETNPETRRRPVGVNQALDSLGDDAEIELDFSGFVNPDSISEALPSSGLGKDEGAGNEEANRVERSSRSKEAGTTSRERFNYASFDCAATMLKTNPECKGSTSILLENKDSYMLNPCSTQNKFFIVELCNDILIDTIALGNYEFFSSTFRTLRVSISDRYPVKPDKWVEIGTFEARNTRGIQAFLVENAVIWARYLRLEFLTHYGNEYYCPVSVLRVHGKTMIDDYRNDFKAARGDDDIEEEDLGARIGQGEVKAEKIAPLSTTSPSVAEPPPEAKSETSRATPRPTATTRRPESDGHRDPEQFKDKCPRTNYISPLIQQVELVTSACASRGKYCNLELTPRINSTTRVFPLQNASTRKEINQSTGNAASHSKLADTSSEQREDRPSSIPTNGSQSTVVESYKPHAGSGTNGTTASSNATTASASSSIANAANSTTHTSSKTTTQPPSVSPPTQESFFKSVHKRLQLLEANSTLSLQYIEEQSRILREAFTKVEKRQLNKTTTFLESLNATVLGELREFRLQYDQIWQSTILELSSQREQSQREAIALSARLTILADEMLWQKRLVYLQFGLILLCLGLTMFSRHNTPYLELPVIQSMLQRSSTGFSRHLGLESPPGTPSRPGSRYGLFSRGQSHFRSPSNDTGKSPSTGYQSPTPPTEDESEPRELRSTESPEPAEPLIRRAVSSPALGQDAATDGESDDENLENFEAKPDLGIGPDGIAPTHRATGGPYNVTERGSANLRVPSPAGESRSSRDG